MLVALYALTMFASASLLFVVQPMVAKLLLPSLGGSSAVWTTCMLFFQAMLLGGYLYAHVGARFLSPRRQAIVHIPLMLIAAVTLPIALPELTLDASEQPTTWLLAALVLSVGAPFFVVSTSAPLLQHWFAHTGHEQAEDPYFLYAASNLGSMVALLGYPFVIEPWLGVTAQTIAWAAVYGLFAVLLLACANVVRGVGSSLAKEQDATCAPPLTWPQRGRWILLAAAPSSLMLGLTQFLTTDIAAVPLLWVLPLALYLMTFILVFARKPVLLPNIVRLLLPTLCAVVFAATAFKVDMWISIILHLLNFFLFAMFFHGTLARERPHPARLTEFFLLLSIGGALGGLFNALIAPSIFDRAVDYHLIMFLSIACMKPADWRIANPHGNRWVMPVFVFAVLGFYLYAQGVWALDYDWQILAGTLAFLTCVFVVGALGPRWENVAFAITLALGAHTAMKTKGLITYERSFFAAYKVYERTYKASGEFRKFSHGTTVHGAQSLDPDKKSVPVSYHHPDGPVGQVLGAIPHREVLVVGLGAGAMASYAHENARFDIYEIDPLVHEIAEEYFTYLEICGEYCEVKIGDGRRLIAESNKKWDIIFLDAYNSDAVPTHLLTREALDLYLEHLNPGGVIVFHVSNRYLDIEGVVGAIAADAGVATRTQLHNPPRRERKEKHIDRSKYSVVARNEADIAVLAAQEDVWETTWRADVVWTDDFTNVVRVFEF